MYAFYELNGGKLTIFLHFVRITRTKLRSRWRNAWREIS